MQLPSNMNNTRSIMLEILLYRKMWLVIIVPIFYLPIPIYYPDKRGKCAYVVLWMITYWTTEALPLAIAGLLPCVVMPLMSIIKIEELASEYIKDTSLLFLGGIVMAMSIEKCKLHQRVALSVLRIAGAPARRVAFGFMVTAWFLSMWMNNTATTTMMVPLVRAIINQVKYQASHLIPDHVSGSSSPMDSSKSPDIHSPKSFHRFTFFHKENPESLFSSQTLKPVRRKQILESIWPFSRSPSPKSLSINPQMKPADIPTPSQMSNAGSFAALDVTRQDQTQQPPGQNQLQLPGPFPKDVKPSMIGMKEFNTEIPILDVKDGSVRPDFGMRRRRDRMDTTSSNFFANDDETYFENSVNKLNKCLLIGVAYSSTIGGTASLIGTSPNLILKAQVEDIVGPNVITFANWMIMALPTSLISFLIAWLWLVFYYMGKNEFLRIFGIHRGEAFIEVLGEKAIKQEYNKLGPMTYAEKNVAALFVLMILLWVTRNPGFTRGWGYFFQEKYVSDTQAALLVSFLLFILPAKNLLEIYQINKGKPTKERRKVKPLMDWKTFTAKMPWDVLFLLGGGFAMAKAIRVSELDLFIVNTFESFGYLPPWLLVIVMCILTCITTEVASNVATATIYLPIVGYMSSSVGVDPLYLMVPVGLTCSFSFMLPVGTPPNSIAYSFGNMDVLSMMKVGSVVSLTCQILIHISLNTWTSLILGINSHKIISNQTTTASVSD